MTKVLVAITDQEEAEDFMTALLPKGLEVYIVDRWEAVLKVVNENQPDLLIFDIDSEVFYGMRGLRELRKNTAVASSKVVVLSNESSLEFVKETMRLGTVGYIYKPITAEQIEENIGTILSNAEAGGQRRQFVRVKPGKFESSRIELLPDSANGISGNIMDISLGGVAVRLNNAQRLEDLQIGAEYSGSVLHLEGEDAVTVTVKAVIARGDTAAFQFSFIDDRANRVLCRYIHSKLMENFGGNDRQNMLDTV